MANHNDQEIHRMIESIKEQVRLDHRPGLTEMKTWLAILEEQLHERHKLALSFPTVDPESSTAVNAEVLIRQMRMQEKQDRKLIDMWMEKAKSRPEVPIPMLLFCPGPARGGICGERHIDEGELTTKPHKTHTCQRCGFEWKQADWPTVGVQFLPGHQNGVK